mgnify:CR=1 FL=1
MITLLLLNLFKVYLIKFKNSKHFLIINIIVIEMFKDQKDEMIVMLKRKNAELEDAMRLINK